MISYRASMTMFTSRFLFDEAYPKIETNLDGETFVKVALKSNWTIPPLKAELVLLTYMDKIIYWEGFKLNIHEYNLLFGRSKVVGDPQYVHERTGLNYTEGGRMRGTEECKFNAKERKVIDQIFHSRNGFHEVRIYFDDGESYLIAYEAWNHVRPESIIVRLPEDSTYIEDKNTIYDRAMYDFYKSRDEMTRILYSIATNADEVYKTVVRRAYERRNGDSCSELFPNG